MSTTRGSKPQGFDPRVVDIVKFLEVTFIFIYGTLILTILHQEMDGMWLFVEARCRLAYSPADATATHCLLLQ